MVCKIAQWVGIPAAKADDVNLIRWTHIVEGKSRLLKIVF